MVLLQCRNLASKKGYMSDSKGVALVADDLEENQVLFKAVLEALKLTVISALNGSEAVTIVQERMANKERLDVIFMDMMMPVMNGVDATQRIRDLGFAGPILVFSAETSRRTAAKAIEAGANHYFSKSVMSLDLARALIEKFCFLNL